MAAAVLTEVGAVRLRVRLTPRAAQDRIGRFEVLADGETVLTVHVRAVPEKGAANEALERLLAKSLGLARSRVAVVSGQTARIKIVRIEGDAGAVAATIRHLAEQR